MIRVSAWTDTGELRYEYISGSNDPIKAGQEAAAAITELLKDNNRIDEDSYIECINNKV